MHGYGRFTLETAFFTRQLVLTQCCAQTMHVSIAHMICYFRDTTRRHVNRNLFYVTFVFGTMIFRVDDLFLQPIPFPRY